MPSGVTIVDDSAVEVTGAAVLGAALVGAALFGVAALGVAALGVAALGVAALGVAVLGVAVRASSAVAVFGAAAPGVVSAGVAVEATFGFAPDVDVDTVGVAGVLGAVGFDGAALDVEVLDAVDETAPGVCAEGVLVGTATFDVVDEPDGVLIDDVLDEAGVVAGVLPGPVVLFDDELADGALVDDGFDADGDVAEVLDDGGIELEPTVVDGIGAAVAGFAVPAEPGADVEFTAPGDGAGDEADVESAGVVPVCPFVGVGPGAVASDADSVPEFALSGDEAPGVAVVDVTVVDGAGPADVSLACVGEDTPGVPLVEVVAASAGDVLCDDASEAAVGVVVPDGAEAVGGVVGTGSLLVDSLGVGVAGAGFMVPPLSEPPVAPTSADPGAPTSAGPCEPAAPTSGDSAIDAVSDPESEKLSANPPGLSVDGVSGRPANASSNDAVALDVEAPSGEDSPASSNTEPVPSAPDGGSTAEDVSASGVPDDGSGFGAPEGFDTPEAFGTPEGFDAPDAFDAPEAFEGVGVAGVVGTGTGPPSDPGPSASDSSGVRSSSESAGPGVEPGPSTCPSPSPIRPAVAEEAPAVAANGLTSQPSPIAPFRRNSVSISCNASCTMSVAALPVCFAQFSTTAGPKTESSVLTIFGEMISSGSLPTSSRCFDALITASWMTLSGTDRFEIVCSAFDRPFSNSFDSGASGSETAAPIRPT